MDLRSYNREAWDREVAKLNKWTVPVTPKIIQKARRGDWSIVMTPTRPVPRKWFPEPLSELEILCLASGGGQQGPVLAATGARVTVLDNSPAQLAQDRLVAAREKLDVNLVEGDMRDLHMFEDKSFDLIIHPVSNVFVPDVKPVWCECHRVLKSGGSMIAGFCNPIMFLFDPKLEQKGILQVKYSIPYSDLEHVHDPDWQEVYGPDEPLGFGHSLDDLIGGQIEAGFVITGFYEDTFGPEDNMPIARYINSTITTRALKPGSS